MASGGECAHLFSIIATVPTGLEKGAADECRDALKRRDVTPERGKISIPLYALHELDKVDKLRAIENYSVFVKEFPEFCKDESSVLSRLVELPSSGTVDWDTPLSVWKYYNSEIAKSATMADPMANIMADTMANTLADHMADCMADTMADTMADHVAVTMADTTMAVTKADTMANTLADHMADCMADTMADTMADRVAVTMADTMADTTMADPMAGREPGGTSVKETEQYSSDQISDRKSKNASSLVDDSLHDSGSRTKTLSGDKSKSTPLTFRVTCVRGGRKHSFSSMEAAAKLGAGLAKFFGWKVQMKRSDIEVLLRISKDSVVICFALNRESKSNRNISHFGPTTLRSAIAYGLLRLANIQVGDVVVDPLCGGGSISIEGAMAWPDTFHISGDNHQLAAPRAAANVNELNKKAASGALKVDVLSWDVLRLPLKTASVDVMVTDLPFGKKSGRKVDNRQLYPAALREMGRVCRPSRARAVLLTYDNKALAGSLLSTNLWKRHLTKWINIGGLKAAVYILYRTDIAN